MRKDLTGQKFGKLLVISLVGSNDKGKSLWNCLYDCGTQCVRTVQPTRTKSCGCLRANRPKTHCKRGHPLNADNRTKKGRCKICTAITAEAYGKQYRLKHPNFHRNRHLKVKYGISYEDQQRMMAEQNGKCAICQRIMDTPCVDHDHQTNEVRELLCTTCNAGIGFLQDDVLVAQAAVDYLKKWKAVNGDISGFTKS